MDGEGPAISDYAIIGDGRTAALVSNRGSIDWLCQGRFDGPAVFCRLLDAEKGGYFQVSPAPAFGTTRRYLGPTNVLVTEFECATGRVLLTDLMPLGSSPSPSILRKVEGVAGEVEVRVDLVPTFDYGRARTTIERVPEGCVARGDGTSLRLACPGELTLSRTGATSTFSVRAGTTHWITLLDGEEGASVADRDRTLTATIEAWERWSARGHYAGPYSAALRRSALALKLLIHRPTGASVAAPTTSLPESPGGVRNWDYRFTWLRDASWLVSALMDLGYHDESMAFIDWLGKLELGRDRLSVFYDLDGRAPSRELELTHLQGFRGARPVRVGNAAADQVQHDVLGEVVASVRMCSDAMPSMRPLRPGLWNLVRTLADEAAARWREPDHGIWEQRGERQRYVASLMFCWVALDSALAIARRDALACPLARWTFERERLRSTLLRGGFDERLSSFTRVVDRPELDAAALLLPRYGLVPARDERMVATVARVGEHLSAGGGLLWRYRIPDGLPGPEGAFVACSYWRVDCLARQGRLDEAHRLFEQVSAHANDVGLLAEEVSPASGELLGNFPQAFSHLALIRAATSLARAPRGATAPSAAR